MMDLIGLPLTSIVLFVLAGILIGHSLWYQDRSGDVEKINWLEKRYLQSRNVGRIRKQEQLALKKMRDQQQLELGSLRQRYEANQIQLKALERSSQATASQLDTLRSQHQTTSEQLADEQRRNEMLVSQLQEVLQAKSGLEAERNQQAETIAKLTESLEKTTPVLQSKVQTLEVELHQSKDALKHAGEDLHARSADLDVIRTQRDTLKQELEVSLQKTAEVGETVAKQEIRLTNVRGQLEELLPLRTESAEACLTIAQQRLELAAQQEEVERLRDIQPMSERRAA